MANTNHINENKRIAKNTVYLYLRMLFGIAVNLFTIRIVWQALGINDYGTYNVVAGVVLTFQFLNSAMVGASQRFLAYAIGEGSAEKTIRTFSTSVQVHTILAFIILILAETIGLWLLDTKINLPPDRHFAGLWVYQASVISMVLIVLSVPYNASIVANEDMKIYGIYGILEILLKFGSALLLLITPFDRLITYSTLLLIISGVMLSLYVRFSRKHYPLLRYKKPDNNSMMRQLFGFAGWTLVGSFAVSVREQGLNIILNIFYNVAYNAARGIANQVSGVVMGFTYNFQMSMFPQITKRYAAGEYKSMLRLVFSGCQFSYYLLLIISVPLFFRADYVLTLWLREGVSPQMITYLRIILIALLVDCMKGPIIAALQATGNVRNFQLMVFFVLISALPMSWIWLSSNGNPFSVVYVVLITNAIALIGRFMLLKQQVGLYGQGRDVMEILVRIILSSFLTIIPVYWLNLIIPNTFVGLVLFCISSLSCSLTVVYLLGLTPGSKDILIRIMKEQILRRFK